MRVGLTTRVFQACGASPPGRGPSSTASWCCPLPLAAEPWQQVTQLSATRVHQFFVLFWSASVCADVHFWVLVCIVLLEMGFNVLKSVLPDAHLQLLFCNLIFICIGLTLVSSSSAAVTLQAHCLHLSHSSHIYHASVCC